MFIPDMANLAGENIVLLHTLVLPLDKVLVGFLSLFLHIFFKLSHGFHFNFSIKVLKMVGVEIFIFLFIHY